MDNNSTDDQNLNNTATTDDTQAVVDSTEPIKEVEETPIEGGEDIAASADQSLSEQGENQTSEPVSVEDGDASLTDENGDTEPTQPEEVPSEEVPYEDPTLPKARWYVVHTYSGHENKVATTLKQRVESERLEDKILDVLVPTQDKIEIKNSKKVSIKEKIFPGYILVKMFLDDASWLAVRTIQGVTSFVGIGNKPTPISDKEVDTIVNFTSTQAPTYKQVFTVNDTVKIVDGPFAEFIGKIDSVDEEKGKVKVLVSIFGRETPVELDFLQIQKI